MKYRIELDGLRSLAVIAVIFYHANLTISGIGLVAGGLYGVDVFFVLSGFLITSIIKGAFESGSFSIVDFYVRRAKRIFPALFFMLLGSLIFAYFILLPDALTRYADSLKSALLFISNHYFLNEDSYTAPNSVYKPLLHTWSLAVEWQFYIVFPFIYYLIHKFAKDYIFPCLLVLTVISFQFANLWVVNHAESAFYLLPTRAWELMLGGLLCYIPRATLLDRTPVILKQALPILSMYMIGYSFIILNHSTPHPSWLTLLPVLGTGLFIVFANEKDLITKILSMKIPVYIGVISYSLYLWHQPVFAFFRIIKNQIPLRLEQFLLLFVISLLFAMLSERFFERPFRSKLTKKKVILLLGLFSFIFLSAVTILKKPEVIYRPFMLRALNNLGGWDSFKIDGKVCNYRNFTDETCFLKPMNDNSNIVLLGDSHSARLSEVTYNYAKENQLGLYLFSTAACYSIEGVFRKENAKTRESLKRQNRVCEANTSFVSNALKKIEPSIILYVIRMDYELFTYSDRDNYLPKIEAQFAKWMELGHKIVVVYDTPMVGENIPNEVSAAVMSTFDKQKAFEELDLSFSLSEHYKKMNNAYDFFDSIHGIERAFAYKALCSNETGRCLTHNDNEIYYTDTDHLSNQGANLVFEQEIKPVLDKVIH